MNFLRLLPSLVLFSALFPGLRAEPATAVATGRWQVLRTVAVGEPQPLADSSRQAIAARLGPGQFVVVNFERPPAAGADPLHLLFFYPSETARRNGQPPIRVWLAAEGLVWTEPDDGSALLQTAAWRAGLDAGNRDFRAALVPGLVAAVLYAGQAAPDTASGILTETIPGVWSWRGRFILANGSREDVTVQRIRGASFTLGLQRTPGPDGTAAARAQPEAVPVEQWIVTAPVAWQPTKRYQLRLALAAMRQDPRRQYQLAVDLLADPSPGAQAQGMKLLQQAAAAGYRDAVALLADLDRGPRHPMGDRELKVQER